MEKNFLPKKEEKKTINTLMKEALLSYQTSKEYNQLYNHQKTAFINISKFVTENKKGAGYLNMPTGSGKTVLFSKIIEALSSIEKEGKKFKTIVLVPNIGLVDQVCGESYKKDCINSLIDLYNNYKQDNSSNNSFEDDREKALIKELREIDAKEKEKPGTYKKRDSGLAKFAPNIRYLAYYSKADNEDKKLVKRFLDDDNYNTKDFDVVVMTYQSLNNLFKKGKIKKDSFDLIICDEVHRTLGEVTGESVNYLEGLKLGFTATDKYYDGKEVKNNFPELIWKLGFDDAIKSNILTKPNIREYNTEKTIIYKGEGDIKIEDQDKEFMLELSRVNKKAINEAKKFIENGKQGIISCMPKRTDSDISGGREVYYHAKEILTLLRNTKILDKKTMEIRNIKAEIIDGNIPDQIRRIYYGKYKNGEIDCFAYVDALREGWDCESCNFLINIRPTLSKVLATQRLGRVLRKDGNIIPEVVDFIFKMKKGLITMDNDDKEIIRSSQLFDSGIPRKKESPKGIIENGKLYMRAFAIYEKMNLIKSLAEDVCNEMNEPFIAGPSENQFKHNLINIVGSGETEYIKYIDDKEYVHVEFFIKKYIEALRKKHIAKKNEMISINDFCKVVNLFSSVKNNKISKHIKHSIKSNIEMAYSVARKRSRYKNINFKEKFVSDSGKTLKDPFYNFSALLAALEVRFNDEKYKITEEYKKQEAEKEKEQIKRESEVLT